MHWWTGWRRTTVHAHARAFPGRLNCHFLCRLCSIVCLERAFTGGPYTMQRRRFISHMTQAAIGMAVPTWATTGYAQETAPGVTDQRITIASSLALTGTLAGFGQAIEQGAGAAFAQVNAQCGVHV